VGQVTVDPIAVTGIVIVLLTNIVIIVWNVATMKASTAKTEQMQAKLETRQEAHGIVLNNHDTQLAIMNSRLETDIEELKIHRARVHEFHNTVMKGFFDVISELRDTLERFRNDQRGTT
jgi:hypothetical protein